MPASKTIVRIDDRDERTVMTIEEYRRLALGFPEAVESAHMNHPDFRVRKKIFATLWPDEQRGVVMLTPEQQRVVTSADPEIFVPVKGGWGAKGSTLINLAAANETAVRDALAMAWRNKALKNLPDPAPGNVGDKRR